MRKIDYFEYYKAYNSDSKQLYSIELSNLQKLFQQLKVEARKIYPSIRFIFLNGHFAYDKVNISSDIDISVILDHKSTSKLSKEALLKKRRLFSGLYRRLHKNYGVHINEQFPAEITSDIILDDVIEGRGFEVSNNRLELPLVTSSDHWLKNYEVDYRIWMSMLAFNNNRLIYGNKKKFFNIRTEVFIVILKFILLKLNIKRDSYLDIKEKVLDHIINTGNAFLGVDKSLLPEIYYDISILFDLSLDVLVKKRFISIKNNEFSVNRVKLLEWEKLVVDKKKNNIYKNLNIYPWKDYYDIL